MRAEFFTGACLLAFGLVTHGFGPCVFGVFLLLMVALDVVPAWLFSEYRLRRAVRNERRDCLPHQVSRRFR